MTFMRTASHSHPFYLFSTIPTMSYPAPSNPKTITACPTYTESGEEYCLLHISTPGSVKLPHRKVWSLVASLEPYVRASFNQESLQAFKNGDKDKAQAIINTNFAASSKLMDSATASSGFKGNVPRSKKEFTDSYPNGNDSVFSYLPRKSFIAVAPIVSRQGNGFGAFAQWLYCPRTDHSTTAGIGQRDEALDNALARIPDEVDSQMEEDFQRGSGSLDSVRNTLRLHCYDCAQRRWAEEGVSDGWKVLVLEDEKHLDSLQSVLRVTDYGWLA